MIMSCLYIETLILGMSKILDNMYIDRSLLVAFVKYILSQIYSHCIRNCTFWYFLAIVETFVFEENIFEVFLYLCCFVYPKTINFHTSGIVGNVPSIGLQYTLSFKWSDFGLKCIVRLLSNCLSNIRLKLEIS